MAKKIAKKVVMRLRLSHFLVFSILLHLLPLILTKFSFWSEEVYDLTTLEVAVINSEKVESKRASLPATLPKKIGISSQQTTPSPQTSEQSDISKVTQAPRILKEHRVAYPERARRAGIEGTVELKIVIDKFGRVGQVDLLRGLGYGLDEAALAAIKLFEFAPAQIGTETVAVQIIYKYRFQLNR